MTTIIRAGTAAEFLSLVPRLARCTPKRSLALVPFAGSSTIGVMRLDLPVDLARDELDRIAATAIGMVCRVQTVDRVAVVVYTDQTLHDGDALAHDVLTQAVLRRAHDCGLDVVNALCVAADGWASYLTPETEFGSLDDIAVAEVSGDEEDVSGDQYAGVQLPSSDLAERERVGRALAFFEEAAEAIRAAPEELSDDELCELVDGAPDAEWSRLLLLTLQTLPVLCEAAIDRDPEAIDPRQAALLLWILKRPGLRDVALSVWCDGIAEGIQAMAAQEVFESGAPYPQEGPLRMMGEGPPPDPDRLLQALALVRRLATLAPRTSRPAPLALAAWLSWALGRSSHASRYLERIAEIDPEYGLATIVASLLSAGHLPDWAYDRAAARRPSAPSPRPSRPRRKARRR